MPVWRRSVDVDVVQAPGTPEEKRWSASIGGDLDTQALFYASDRIRIGDEIHSEFFDEPRIVASVTPVTASDGSLTHWEARMVPLSQWKRASRPPSPQYIASGQGARINVGSTDHSVQQFQNQTAEFRAVERELDALRAAIEQFTAAMIARTH